MIRSSPITEADLHAWVDDQLAAERTREVEAYLDAHPEDARRVDAWRAQKYALRALFDPVQDEPLPAHLVRCALSRPGRGAWRIAACVAAVLASGAAGWELRGIAQDGAPPLAQGPSAAFVQRAAVAHAVYSPEQRRPVEVDAVHEEQLVAWLSKRMGTPLKPPHLQALGYALEGGRLLPGGQGPVAQFMYRDAIGQRLTLYVSNEIGMQGNQAGRTGGIGTGFRFAQHDEVATFYWVDAPFGYAISAASTQREMLAQVSQEVYRQLASRDTGR